MTRAGASAAQLRAARAALAHVWSTATAHRALFLRDLNTRAEALTAVAQQHKAGRR
jgi:hypothetical protein